MYRIVTKRHGETKRFTQYPKPGIVFKTDDYATVQKYIDQANQTQWMVQLQSDSGFSSGWHELKCWINHTEYLIH